MALPYNAAVTPFLIVMNVMAIVLALGVDRGVRPYFPKLATTGGVVAAMTFWYVGMRLYFR